MMKQVRLNWILFYLVMTAVVFSFNAWALDTGSDTTGDTAQNEIHQLDDVVVTANRADTSAENVSANVDVITQDEIKTMPVSTAAEVLQYVPGVYVEFNGGPGSQATATIQGSDVRQVAVYKDGVLLNQLVGPKTDLSYISVDTIDRIEIFKGTASSAWGSSLGGVINIVTKEPDPDKTLTADVRTSYGKDHTSKNSGSISGTIDKFGYLVSATHNESDGFIDHTEYEQDEFYAKLNYKATDKTRISMVSSLDKGKTADPVLNAYYWDDNSQKRTYQRVMAETALSDNFLLTIEGRHHRLDSEVVDVNPDDSRAVWSDYEEETWGASTKLVWDISDDNRLVAGYDGDWGEYKWILFYIYPDDYDIYDHDTGNWATYVNDTQILGNITLNAGARLDDNDDFGSEISPSFGMVYKIPDKKALIRANISKGFSAPDAVALAPDNPYGNPDLEPEESINYQLGGEIQAFNFIVCNVNFFYSDIDELITYVLDDTALYGERMANADKVKRRGVDATITAKFDFGLTLSAGASVVNQDVNDDDEDDMISEFPRKMFNVNAIYNYKFMTHALHGRYIEYYYSNDPELPDSDAGTIDEKFVYDYLLTIMLPACGDFCSASLFGAVYNIFDTKYQYKDIWPQPGRWAEAGVRIEF